MKIIDMKQSTWLLVLICFLGIGVFVNKQEYYAEASHLNESNLNIIFKKSTKNQPKNDQKDTPEVRNVSKNKLPQLSELVTSLVNLLLGIVIILWVATFIILKKIKKMKVKGS
ncbi:MAG: hypothetical protein ACTH54_07855 [Vagococcus salmoninarum]|uniref:hypothetical protein n=1 Tax=Vagococcus salmoninarum TaxID=2739 RepID=UPI003F96910E